MRSDHITSWGETVPVCIQCLCYARLTPSRPASVYHLWECFLILPETLWSCLFNHWMFLWLKLAVCLGTLVQFTDLTVQDFWVMKSFRLDGRSHWQCRTVPEGFRVALSQPKAFPLQLVRERIRFLLRTGWSWLKPVLPVAVQLRLWHHQAGVVFGAAMFDACSEKKSFDGTRWDDVLPAGFHLHKHGGPMNL